MRTDILHIGAGELTYEIRNIVRIADKMQKMGINIKMENIGDPVAKGEKIPQWMKKIVSDLAMEDFAYSYCPTQGILTTREFLAEKNNTNGGVHITPDDIIFFNGLGDAITKIYGFLRRTARIITPSPTYSTHSSSEAAHAGLPPVCYPLNPDNHWYPDIDELRKRVKYNPAVAGILIINPDNPTGAVYPEEILREIVAIAKKFDLFIIADEIYHNLIFNSRKTRYLSDVIGDVPGISMKGISKELPWPGRGADGLRSIMRIKMPILQLMLRASLMQKWWRSAPQHCRRKQFLIYLNILNIRLFLSRGGTVTKNSQRLHIRHLKIFPVY